MWEQFWLRPVGAGFRVLYFLVLTAAGTPSAYAQPGIAPLEEMWRRGEYTAVFPKLIDYRERTGTKTSQIDYMIATSACRIPDRRQLGNQFFAWILYNYNPSAEDRATIESERQRCSPGRAPKRLQTPVPATLVGVSYSGKGGAEIRATSSGNGTAEVIAPIPSEIFLLRLFDTESAVAAASQVKKTLGAGTQVEHAGHFLLAVVPLQSRELLARSPDSTLPATLSLPDPPHAPNRAVGRELNQSPSPETNLPQAPNAAAGAMKPPPPNAGPTSGPPGPDPGPNAPPMPGPEAAEPNSPGGGLRPRPQANTNPRSNMVQQRPLPSTQAAQRTISIFPDEYDLKRVGADLERYLQFFVFEYEMQKPSTLITVYFTRSVGELQSLAKTLHGIGLAPGTIGYSFPPDQSMAGWASGSAYGTFVHELFHMMVRYNFGDIPPWLDEGMAALYEVSRFEGTRAVGIDNWRGEILRDSWANRPTLRTLVQMNRSAFDVAQGPSSNLVAGVRQAMNHATARYFMQYLQSRGNLSPVYRAFAKRPMDGQPAKQAVEILERVLDRPVDQVDSDFAQWFQSHH